MWLCFPETDLHNVIKKGTVLEDVHRRYIMYQMFRATKYLHTGSVIHRDLKVSTRSLQHWETSFFSFSVGF